MYLYRDTVRTLPARPLITQLFCPRSDRRRLSRFSHVPEIPEPRFVFTPPLTLDLGQTTVRGFFLLICVAEFRGGKHTVLPPELGRVSEPFEIRP